MLIWIIRFAIVLFFLIMFLWRSKSSWAWGIGLLTASAVVLFDALREQELLSSLGFLGFFLGGLTVAGAFFWANAMLGGLQASDSAEPETNPAATKKRTSRARARGATSTASAANNGSIDNQMIFDQIRTNLNADDVRDLIFDLGLYENDVINPSQDMHQVILNLMESAESGNKSAQLAMSVERILTPVPRESLPRLAKISAETPPALLRQFLVANYNMRDLSQITTHLGLDWEELGTNSKKSRIRELLLHLRRRNRIPELIQYLHELNRTTAVSNPA